MVLAPEHARLFGQAGWSKDDMRQFIYGHAVNARAELAMVGKDAISRHTHWRLPADHPDAVPDRASSGANPDLVPVLNRRRGAGHGRGGQQRGRLRRDRDVRAARRPSVDREGDGHR